MRNRIFGGDWPWAASKSVRQSPMNFFDAIQPASSNMPNSTAAHRARVLVVVWCSHSSDRSVSALSYNLAAVFSFATFLPALQLLRVACMTLIEAGGGNFLYFFPVIGLDCADLFCVEPTQAQSIRSRDLKVHESLDNHIIRRPE